MSLRFVWPIVVLVLVIIGYLLIKGSEDNAPVEEIMPGPEPSSAVQTAEPEPAPGGAAIENRPTVWSAPEQAGPQQTQPGPVSQGGTVNSRPQSESATAGPGSATPTGQVIVGGSASVMQGVPVTESPISPPEMGSTGVLRAAPESNEFGDTGEIGLAPEAGEIDLEYGAPEAGVPQFEGLPPEASDPGTIGPAPEDSTKPTQ